ncbi:hypothetical protein D9756_010970 [Leucocoprinus leucothites]|uniref:Uncharacterized protein n=1 Tax=Leucocoprinus leucothites TaxID=201217 RepID=A0A8H5FQX5_9AGAR|nr:hypothetical protein D9756_010970 [Leucoagaricus leucothites]
MPHLWNHPPIIRIMRGRALSVGFIEKWKLFLDRSRNLPLRLHLSFDIPRNEISGSPYPILRPFHDCSQRWEHVTVSHLMVMHTQLQFQAVRRKLGLLRSVTLNFAETTIGATENMFNIFEVAPNLTTILVHSPSHRLWKSHLEFPWGQLTTYKETGIDMGTFPVILGLSPHLETLHYQGRNFMYHLTDLVHHSHLRHLSVDAGSLRAFWEQLERLTAPSLESLSVIVPDDQLGTFSTSAVTHFLARSGCSLRKLSIRLGFEAIGHDLLNLFLLTPDLEFLELGSCHTLFLQDIVLEKLVYNKYSPLLLPRLCSLTLNYYESPDLDDIAVISHIVSSRQQLTANFDSSIGQLYAVLDHVRIIVSDMYTRFHILCQLGDWKDPLTTFDSYTQPLPGIMAVNIGVADHIVALVERAGQCYIDGILPISPAQILSLFTLAHLIDDSFDEVISIEVLEDLGVFHLAKSHFIQMRWILGCKSDILYVHPIPDQNTLTEIWTHVADRNTTALDTMLGYEAHQGREDDLVEATYSRYRDCAWHVALIFVNKFS